MRLRFRHKTGQQHLLFIRIHDKFLFERVSPSVLPEGNPPPSSEGGIRLFPRKKTNLFQIEDFRNGFVFDGNKNTLPPSAHYAKHNVGGVNRMVDGGRENPLNKNLSSKSKYGCPVKKIGQK